MKLYKTYEGLKLLSLALLLPGFLVAQTVNTGELTINPNTQFSTVGDLDNKSEAIIINDGEAFMYAHFNNDGIIDFTFGEEGLIRFEGTTVQQLSGGSISYFYDVLFDNDNSDTASFELGSSISIANEANFKEGIVRNDDFGGLIIFEDDATHRGVYDGSHVDGLVQKNGDDSFTYPIGDRQRFQYAAISAPDNLGDVFTAKYYFENVAGLTINGENPTTTTEGVITLLDNSRFWTVERESGTSDVLLTLSFDGDNTLSNIITNPLAEIHIVRWDELQQLWVDEGGIVDVDNRTVTTPLRLENYGIFTLGRINEELIVVPSDTNNIVIYNAVTANGDGMNDSFIIKGIENLANNEVEVFNRWGVKVFATKNYGSNGNVFDGFSDGRLTVGGDNQLPTGTYYYVLSYDFTRNGTTERIKKAGYLYLNAQ